MSDPRVADLGVASPTAVQTFSISLALRNQAALEKRLRTGGKGQAEKLGKGVYGRVAQTGKDRIFVVLAEFGDRRHQAYQDDPDSGAQRYDGPLHNQIPKPDRKWDGNATDDNSTNWVKDFNQAHYEQMMFGKGESFKDFYTKLSNGRFLAKGEVQNWVQVPYNESRYGSNNYSDASTYWPFIRDSASSWYDAQKAAGKTDAQITDYLKQFDQVEQQHPYSVWARRATLMSAFCSYQANEYDTAISTADQYISLHPGSPEVAYAFYLKAISLYEQIVDVGRDQTNTEGALVALQDVVQRFPDTEYARDATLKIDLTMDHLAGKQMEVGRYYLTRGDYIGAINRFRVVVEQYQTTSQIAEALERLTEAYYSMGLDSEAQTAAAVLGANYPGSGWYQNAYNILKGRNLTPAADKNSWIYQAFHKIF